MKNKLIIITAIVLIICLGIAFFVFIGSDDNNDSSDNSQSQQSSSNTNLNSEPTSESEEELNISTYTVEEVAQHNSQNDCWTIINGAVYDITSYLKGHPGGSAIQQACGIDGTTLFTERKNSDGEKVGSGTPHSTNANNILSSYKIGELN